MINKHFLNNLTLITVLTGTVFLCADITSANESETKCEQQRKEQPRGCGRRS